ncbi:hypothetical protein [Streptomyces sp. NPDC001530]|uniref:hypothetical protein n=1 Tax=Streptomyces sp. NPDC001530 TaxID=3364582 RepID=UPI003685EFCA
MAKTAANMHIGYLAKMAQDQVLNGNVTFNPNDYDKRFRPDTISLAADNDLGAKYNLQDARRHDIIGRMAISALADGMHAVSGTPMTPPGGTKQDMPVLQIDQAAMDAATMRAFQVGTVRVLPQLSLGKDNQDAWRKEPTQNPSDLTNLKGEGVTLTEASNIGVSQAAAAGIPGLDKPAHLPYTEHYSKSGGNSPARTPSPDSSNESVGTLTRQVAGLTMPRTPSPEGPDAPASAAVPPPPRPGAKGSGTTGPGK